MERVTNVDVQYLTFCCGGRSDEPQHRIIRFSAARRRKTTHDDDPTHDTTPTNIHRQTLQSEQRTRNSMTQFRLHYPAQYMKPVL
jgi:hypothetical protein